MEKGLKFYDISSFFHFDERGWRINPYADNYFNISQKGSFHIVSILPNAVRGNHIHLTTDEWIAFWGGKCEFFWEERGELKRKLFEKDKAYLVFIPEGIAHACKNVGDNESFLFSYYVKRVSDYEKETVRKVLIS